MRLSTIEGGNKLEDESERERKSELLDTKVTIGKNKKLLGVNFGTRTRHSMSWHVYNYDA